MSYSEHLIIHEKFVAKFLLNQPVYFIYTFEDAMIRYDGEDSFYVKFKGAKEFKSKHSNRIVVEGFLESKEVTKSEYDAW